MSTDNARVIEMNERVSKGKQTNVAQWVAIVLLATSALLTGCVSTTERVFTEEASPKKALERRVSLARQYIGEGNWDAAKRNLDLANEIDSESAEVNEAFALVYQSTGEFELAQEHFERSIKADRDCSRCRNNYAAFLYSRANYVEAESQLRTVVKDSLYQGRPRAFVNLGLCRLQLKDTAGAEEAFVRALSMEGLNSIALLEVAIIRLDAGDARAAAGYYDSYRKVIRQQTARGLWAGIRLARLKGDRDALASYALALSSRFPDSDEYAAYSRSINR